MFVACHYGHRYLIAFPVCVFHVFIATLLSSTAYTGPYFYSNAIIGLSFSVFLGLYALFFYQMFLPFLEQFNKTISTRDMPATLRWFLKNPYFNEIPLNQFYDPLFRVLALDVVY